MTTEEKKTQTRKSNTKHEIISIGGGLLRLGETIRIDKFIVRESGKKHPKVLFIPTASHDLPAYSVAFKSVYEKLGCQVKILRLFSKRKLSQTALKKLITGVDIIYVGGGDYDVLLLMLVKCNIIPFIRLAYQQGTILTGLSAGGAIWYEYLIDNDRNKNTLLKKGIGILNGVVILHYKTTNPFPSEARKTKTIITAIEDKCAAVYIDERLMGSVSVTKERAFTISPPYVRNKQVKLYFHKN
jgi:dipeptidase E